MFNSKKVKSRQFKKNKCSGREGGGGRGLGWGMHVNPWLIHVNVWQNPLQYCKVISLQLIKINEKKRICAILIGFIWNSVIGRTDIWWNKSGSGSFVHEKCSTSLIIREMLKKTIVTYHLAPVRMNTIKKSTVTNAGEKGTHLHC